MATANAPRAKLSSKELPTDPEAAEATHDTLPPASGFVPLEDAVRDTIPAPPWVEDPADDTPDSAAS